MGLFSRKKKSDNIVELIDEVEETSKTHGPWDESEAPDRDDLIDAGALKLPRAPGKIQYTIDKRTRRAIGALVQMNNSAMQINLYAAPRSEGLWDEVRTELVESIRRQGGDCHEEQNKFGDEVVARIPAKDTKAQRHVRYVGVDGPRWFLRASIEGDAVTNEEVRDLFYGYLEDVVVCRGQDPHPPRDLILLTMSDDVTAKLNEKLKKPGMPKRGPEITEIR